MRAWLLKTSQFFESVVEREQIHKISHPSDLRPSQVRRPVADVRGLFASFHADFTFLLLSFNVWNGLARTYLIILLQKSTGVIRLDALNADNARFEAQRGSGIGRLNLSSASLVYMMNSSGFRYDVERRD